MIEGRPPLPPSPASVGLIGVGVDVELVARWEEPDLRLFSEEEANYCRRQANPAESFAGTWCVKEATVKALSPIALLSLRDVYVGRDESGAPSVRIPSAIQAQVMVSASHSAGIAIAMALALHEGPKV